LLYAVDTHDPQAIITRVSLLPRPLISVLGPPAGRGAGSCRRRSWGVRLLSTVTT
jgi:hypothetical protein